MSNLPWDILIRLIKGESLKDIGEAAGKGELESGSSLADAVADLINVTNVESHDVSWIKDTRPQSAEKILGQGFEQFIPNATDPTSSASNVINYDQNKSALENMFGYAVDNNSASAYSSFLENKHQQEMADTAIARAVADAESQGISKYQLFQGGNMAAATPSSSGSLWNSYENAMNRRESMSEKELAAIVAIVTGTLNGAAKIMAAM